MRAHEHVCIATDGTVFIFQGIASDPTKLAQYRAIARIRASAIANGDISITDPRVRAFDAQLTKLPEHTWGFNEGNMGGTSVSSILL